MEGTRALSLFFFLWPAPHTRGREEEGKRRKEKEIT
jgi:hypothetical protein